jgi:hypothetical protein
MYTELMQLHPSRRRETSSSIILRMQPHERKTAKEKSTTISQETERMFFFKLTSPEQSYAAELHQDNRQ